MSDRGYSSFVTSLHTEMCQIEDIRHGLDSILIGATKLLPIKKCKCQLNSLIIRCLNPRANRLIKFAHNSLPKYKSEFSNSIRSWA